MRLIDADALEYGYMHIGYDPNEHPEESYMEGWCKGFNAGVDHCIGHVIHAPTIEPECKTGKWEKDTKTGRWRCSECYAFALKTDDGRESLSNYCPVCGVKMKEGEQDA